MSLVAKPVSMSRSLRAFKTLSCNPSARAASVTSFVCGRAVKAGVSAARCSPRSQAPYQNWSRRRYLSTEANIPACALSI